MTSRSLVGSLVVAAALAGAAPGFAQGLGDAARQERERRDKLKVAGKSGSAVVDAESLKTNKGQVANGAPSGGTAPDGGTGEPTVARSPVPTETETADMRGQDEAEWRQRLSRARENVATLQKQYDVLNSQHLAPGEYFVDSHGKRMIGSAERLQKYVAQAKAALDAGQRQLEALEERGRREHVPPGWLR